MVWAGKSWKELNVQGKEQRYVVGRFGSRELYFILFYCSDSIIELSTAKSTDYVYIYVRGILVGRGSKFEKVKGGSDFQSDL